MNITIKDKNGVLLKTQKKYCNEDIAISVDAKDLSIIPTTEDQTQEGLFSKVTVAGSSELVPENIKKGITLFGVEGGFDAVDTRDATATSNDVIVGKTAYVNNIKLAGAIPDNGELDYTPLEEEQLIPTGYTLGGRISAVDITALQEYKDCLDLSNQIVFSEYIQVEYITVKAGNGFDLGVPLWNYTSWDLEAEFSIDEIRNYQHIFSISDDDANHESWIDSTGNYWLRLSSGVKKDGGGCAVNRKTKIRHKWTNGSCQLYQDDVRLKTVSYAPFTSPLNLRFGKRQTTYFTGNIYSIKMYQGNDILVGDFIPVINNSNGEATLYNLVTKTFVTNLGINNNVAGPQV